MAAASPPPLKLHSDSQGQSLDRLHLNTTSESKKKLALIQSICSRTLLDEVEGRLLHIVQQFCDVSLWSSYKQRDLVFCCAVTLAESQNKADKMVKGLEALMDKESHTECLKPEEDTAGQKIPALV